jgi:hypothetical protein
MYKFETIKFDETNEWNKIIKQSLVFDFYHTPFYQNLQSEGEAVLLVAYHQSDFISFPLVLREISQSNYYDVTSAYGYCGPISNKEIQDLDQDFINYFKRELDAFFLENNVIAAFSRLHPLIDQKSLFDGFGEIIDLNKTVSIDLTVPIEQQRRTYRKSLKSELNQLRKLKYIVEDSKKESDIEEFIRVYNTTMDRLDASENYYFDKEYFHSFLSNDDFEAKLLIAKFEGEVIAGAIFTMVGDIMQYHLAGTLPEFARRSPMKLILDEARLLASSLNLKYLHLGGGVGGGDSDSLFKFKSGFSKEFYQFSIWRHIIDHEKYNELVEKNNLSTQTSNFFPLYRLKD